MSSAPSVISLCAGRNALKLRKDETLATRFSIIGTLTPSRSGLHVCFWQIVLQIAKG